MILTELIAPVKTAVTVEALSAHLRLGSGFADDGSQDGALEMYIRVASAAIEARTGKALIARRLRLNLTGWSRAERQALPMAPVSRVDAVTVLDSAGTATSIGQGRWILRQDMHRPELVANGGSLPSIPTRGAVEIDFEAGFGPDPEDIPSDLRHAVLLLAAHYFEARNAGEGAGLPFAVAALIEPHRQVRL